jgi:hypothetical protein
MKMKLQKENKKEGKKKDKNKGVELKHSFSTIPL